MSEKKISKAPTAGRLCRNDELHLEKQVKLFKTSDPKFKDNSAALRYYVNLGIKTEVRSLKGGNFDETKGSLTARSNSNFGSNDPLIPIKNSIDILTKAVDDLSNKQYDFFQGQTEGITDLRNELLTQFEKVSTLINTPSEMEINAERFLKEILKNIVVFRCIHYVFLLGISPGSIPIKYETIDWQRVVKIVYDRAAKISPEELESISAGELNNEKIRGISQEMFGMIQGVRKQQ